jgi:hypothetical protein
MTVTLSLIFLGVLALLLVLRLAKGRTRMLADASEISQRIRAVDVRAFQNLLDPQEEEFLRANLPPPAFRTLRRERQRAAIDYIVRAAQNAVLLMRMGEAARHSGNPSVAEAGEQLVDNATRLRLLTLQAMVKLYIGMYLPATNLSTARIADHYERTTRLVILLGCLKYSARGVSSSL